MQAEASAYLARMTTRPSRAWIKALNQFVYDLKRQGLWAGVVELWLHCAETQQAALLGLKGLVDATLTGAPTFTPALGFSGLNAANQVLWPILSASLPSDAVMSAFCGKLNGGATGDMIECDAGSGYAHPGNFQMGVSGRLSAPSVGDIVGTTTDIPLALVAGNFLWSAGAFPLSVGGSLSTKSSNYRTKARADQPLTDIRAYGFVSATATEATKFARAFVQFLAAVGAID